MPNTFQIGFLKHTELFYINRNLIIMQNIRHF